MTLRARIFLLITVVVLIVLVISLLLVVKFKNNPVVTVPGESPGQASLTPGNVVALGTAATVIPPNIKVAPIDSAVAEENAVRQLAKIFVERFHTYSSDNIFQNLRDVQIMVTADYWKTIGLPLTRPINPPPTIVALTTKVLAITSSNVQSTIATVALKAQKISTNGSVSATGYVDYIVSLVKSGSSWLVVSEIENK